MSEVIEPQPMAAVEATASQPSEQQLRQEEELQQGAQEPELEKPLSKKQMKKQAKLERMIAYRAERKASEKAAKVEAQAAKRAARQAAAAAMTPEEREAQKQKVQETLVARKKDAQDFKDKMAKCLEPGNQRFAIDLDFDGLMPEGDMRSLCQQLSYSYSANKRVAAPLHMHLLGFKGPIQELAQKLVAGIPNWFATRSEKTVAEYFEGRLDEVVYLTADSDVELTTLDPSKIYVIGGIVDHNKYKGLCLKRAKEAGIATARLPIQKHVQLESSSVLAVNHVTQILVEYAQSKDWAAVLNEVLPKRKRADFNAGEGKSKGKGAEAASGGEQAQGENGEKAGAEAEAVQSVQGDGGMVEEQAAGGEGFGDGDVKASGLGQGAQQGAETSTGHNTAGSSQEVQGSGDLEPPAKRLHV